MFLCFLLGFLFVLLLFKQRKLALLELSSVTIKKLRCVLVIDCKPKSSFYDVSLSAPAVLPCFRIFFSRCWCNGMHGMYLASYQVGHRGADWFVVTMRAEGCLHCKCEAFTDVFSSLSLNLRPPHVIILFLSEVVSVRCIYLFYFFLPRNRVTSACREALDLFSVNSVRIKCTRCFVDALGYDAEYVCRKTRAVKSKSHTSRILFIVRVSEWFMWFTFEVVTWK